MKLPGFIGGGYTLETINIDSQRSINLFPQITESQNQADGQIGALVTTPGLKLLGTCGTGPIRGIYVASTGGMAVVSGSEVYRVGTGWTFIKAGDLLTSTGRVSMSDNGSQLTIVDGKYGYVISLATGVLTQITGGWFPGADTCCFSDGYTLFNNPGTGQFYWSNLYDSLNGDALNFITAEGSPDATIAVVANKRQIVVFGAKTVEVFWNTGSETTYNRIDGAFIEYGCAAPHTALHFADTVMWLGSGQTGQGIVWQMNGFQAKRVSDHAIEQAIQGYDLSGATAWAYQDGGHAFYCLNIPGMPTTFVYDISTGKWHERCALDTDGNFNRHRGDCYAYGFGAHVVGDWESGNLYALDHDTRQDNGSPLKWVRRTPQLSAGGRRVFVSKFQLMAQVGHGLDGTAPVGVDPQVELRYSDDFGNTWSNPRKKSLGKLGEYSKRVIWRQLGQTRNRVWEVSGSDPVKVALMNAEVDAMPGAS